MRVRGGSCHTLIAGFLICAPLSPSRAQDFFAGKTITITTHSAAGGQYDGYLRLLARYIGKYIPGNPNIAVLNQVGAGGLLAVNHALTLAPRDGTFLTLVANGLLLFQGVGQPGLRGSLGDLNWIGNFSAANAITVVSASAGVRTIEDVRRKEIVIGSSGAGSISALLPAAHNALAGAKFRVVQGYEGSAAMNLAIRRGELHGRSGSTWKEYQADFPQETRDGTLLALTQTGEAREADLPDTPLLTEIVGDDPGKLAAARFVSEALTQNRALAAPPDVPAEIVAVLRAAFEKSIAEPEFLANAKRAGLEIAPTTGEYVTKVVKDVLAAPAETRALAKAAVDPLRN